MDREQFLRWRMQRRMADKAPLTAVQLQHLEALHRIQKMIRDVLGRWPPSDGGLGDRSSLVPCPKKPRPNVNRSAVAVPLTDDEHR